MDVKHLSNDTTMIYKHVPFVQTAAMSVLVRSGARFDHNMLGISHLAEHCIIASGNPVINLFYQEGILVSVKAAKDHTLFSIKTTYEDASDIFARFFKLFEIKLNDDIVSKEQMNIALEIRERKKRYTPLIVDELASSLYPCCTWIKVLNNMQKYDHSVVESFIKTNYTGSNTVVSIVGDIDKIKCGYIAHHIESLVCKGRYVDSMPAGPITRERFQFNALPAHEDICLLGIAFPIPVRFVSSSIINEVYKNWINDKALESIRKYNLGYSAVATLEESWDYGIISLIVQLAPYQDAIRQFIENLVKILEIGPRSEDLIGIYKRTRKNKLMSLDDVGFQATSFAKNWLRKGIITSVDNGVLLEQSFSDYSKEIISLNNEVTKGVFSTIIIGKHNENPLNSLDSLIKLAK